MNSKNLNLRVALVWNGTIYQEETFVGTKKPVITLGDAESNTFFVPAAGFPATMEIFEREENGYRFRFTDKIKALTLHVEDEEFDLASVIKAKRASKTGTVQTEEGQASLYELSLQVGDWGILELGQVTVFFQVSDKLLVIPAARARQKFDGPLAASVLFAAVLHIAFVIAAFLVPPKPELDHISYLDRFARFAVDDVLDAIEEEEDAEEDDTTAKKAGGEEGEFGDVDSEFEESVIPEVDATMRDEIDVKNIGIHEALSSDVIGAGPLDNLFAQSDGFAATMDVAMAGDGDGLQVGRGAGGMGMRGGGSGGGGEGYGRVGGLGKVDTGGGAGAGGAVGRGSERKVQAQMSTGAPAVGDFCDRADIRRVVNARQNAIRHCFERELQTNPTLSGNISVTWRVQLDGSVSNAAIGESTMNDRRVEGCIIRVVERMRFEAPDGGICAISYPFVFTGIQ